MRKIFFATLAVVALSTSGCASIAAGVLNIPTEVLTKSVENPVKKGDLYRLENGLIVVVTAMNTYKKLCEQRKIADSCVGVVTRLQGYSRTARPLLRSLRTFVRTNDQVNARVVFETLQHVVAEFRSEAQTAGAMKGAQ